MTKFECPAEGNKCETCVVLAKNVIARTLHESELGISQRRGELIAENAHAEAIVNDEMLPARMLNMLTCDERQARAENIGHKLGETLLNHRQ